jgi:hypothetical protein
MGKDSKPPAHKDTSNSASELTQPSQYMRRFSGRKMTSNSI